MNRTDIKKHKVLYKDKLGFDINSTFGIEIEFEKVKLDVMKKLIGEELVDWKVVDEFTVTEFGVGGEVVSPILVNNKKSFDEINRVCELMKSVGAKSTDFTATHIHVGSNILNSDFNNWFNLMKLWVCFENIIYNYSLVGKSRLRNNIFDWAVPFTCDISEFRERVFLDYNSSKLKDFVYNNESTLGLNFYKSFFLQSSLNDTVEFRSMNSTFDPVIIQNGINMFTRMMMYSSSSEFDSEYIDYRIERLKNGHYKKFNYNDLCKFSEMIFNDKDEILSFTKINLDNKSLKR